MFSVKPGKQIGSVTVGKQSACALFDLQLTNTEFQLQQKGCIHVLTGKRMLKGESMVQLASCCLMLPMSP